MIDQQENGLAVRYRLLLAACADVRLKPADTRVLSVVLGLMKKEQEYAWPSLKFIGDKAGLDRRTVTRSVGALVDLGYLMRESGDARTANVYRPGAPVGNGDEAPSGEDVTRGEEAPSGGLVQGVGADSSTSVGVYTPLYKGLKAVEVKAVETPPPLAALAPAPGDANETPKPAKTKKPTRRTDDSDEAAAAGWLEFWAAYPRGAGKKAARKVWNRIAPDDTLQARMLAAIAVQRRSDAWRKEGGNYIPHAATWLNGERWTDSEPKPGVVVSRLPDEIEQLEAQLVGERSPAKIMEINAQLCILRDQAGTRPMAGISSHNRALVPLDHRTDEEKTAEIEAALQRQRARMSVAKRPVNEIEIDL